MGGKHHGIGRIGRGLDQAVFRSIVKFYETKQYKKGAFRRAPPAQPAQRECFDGKAPGQIVFRRNDTFWALSFIPK